MINIDELLGYPYKTKPKLDEEFILKHLMFLSLPEAQNVLDEYFPGYEIIVDIHNQHGYLIIDEHATVVASITVS